MADLTKEILAEKENIEIALANLTEALSREEKTVIELTAIGAFMLNIYNGMENILKQSQSAINIKTPNTDKWHKDLLNASVSNNILTEELTDKLYEYLTFRHFFVHGYGFRLEESRIEDLASNMEKIWSQFLTEIQEFFKRM